MFGSILDADRRGSFELAADLPATTKQFYFPDTNVLITRFFTKDGVGEIQDFMPLGDGGEADRHRLIRRALCVRIDPLPARVVPRFGYGLEPHTVRARRLDPRRQQGRFQPDQDGEAGHNRHRVLGKAGIIKSEPSLGPG